MQRYGVEAFLWLRFHQESTTQTVRAYRGRAARVAEERHAQVAVRVDEPARETAVRRLGWRVDGTNQPRAQLSLAQAGLAYRNEYQVARSLGRRKGRPLSLRGKVGIILAYEASRLARNNTDWYTLIDLATVVGTLLADTEGVYDPRQYNDRLLLGLRGLLSEAELHILHLRMAAGRQRQVERGTYRQSLPTGLLRNPAGQVVKDPDRQVRQTLELILG